MSDLKKKAIQIQQELRSDSGDAAFIAIRDSVYEECRYQLFRTDDGVLKIRMGNEFVTTKPTETLYFLRNERNGTLLSFLLSEELGEDGQKS